MRNQAPLTVPDHARKQAIESLRRYAEENFDEEMGELKAALLFDHILTDLGPAIYNQAVADAQAYVEERAADLDATLQQAEFPISSRRKR